MRLLPKLNYSAILQAVEELSPHVPGGLPELPKELPLYLMKQEDLAAVDQTEVGEEHDSKVSALTGEAVADEKLEANLHKVLFDVHLIDGALICPGTGRRFPVKESIPNMLLHADEI